MGPAKTQISLGIHPVWSKSLLSAWRKLGSLATYWAHSEDSDQTGQIPRLIWVFAGAQVIMLVFSLGGPFFVQTLLYWQQVEFELPHDKTNKMAYVPSEESDQPGHPPSLIRVFAVCMKKAWVLSYSLSAQRRHWSDWTDAQADLNLRWAQSHFVGLSWGDSFNLLLLNGIQLMSKTGMVMNVLQEF